LNPGSAVGGGGGIVAGYLGIVSLISDTRLDNEWFFRILTFIGAGGGA